MYSDNYLGSYVDGEISERQMIINSQGCVVANYNSVSYLYTANNISDKSDFELWFCWQMDNRFDKHSIADLVDIVDFKWGDK